MKISKNHKFLSTKKFENLDFSKVKEEFIVNKMLNLNVNKFCYLFEGDEKSRLDETKDVVIIQDEVTALNLKFINRYYQEKNMRDSQIKDCISEVVDLNPVDNKDKSVIKERESLLNIQNDMNKNSDIKKNFNFNSIIKPSIIHRITNNNNSSHNKEDVNKKIEANNIKKNENIQILVESKQNIEIYNFEDLKSIFFII